MPALAGFAAAYAELFKQPPSGLAIEGHVALTMVLAARAHGAASLAMALRTLRTTAEETLFATRWEGGEPLREGFIARIGGGGDMAWLTLAAE